MNEKEIQAANAAGEVAKQNNTNKDMLLLGYVRGLGDQNMLQEIKQKETA